MPEHLNPDAPAPEPTVFARGVSPASRFRGIATRPAIIIAAFICVMVFVTLTSKKPGPATAPKSVALPPVPMEETTQSNVDQAQSAIQGPNRQQQAPSPLPQTGGYPGPTGGAAPQQTPEEQMRAQMDQREAEMRFNAMHGPRVFSVVEEPPLLPTQAPPVAMQSRAGQGEMRPGTPAEAPSAQAVKVDAAAKGKPEIQAVMGTGPQCRLYEGVLMNRLDGDAVGPVDLWVSSPVYSMLEPCTQKIVIPAGTVIVGEAQAIGGNTVGQRRRISIVLHRMVMPDGYSVDLDQFRGLGQIGDVGLTGKVNNHYFQIFGAAVALGVTAGAAQSQAGGYGNGPAAFQYGATQQVSQAMTHVLDRFIDIPPSITVREGTRVKIIQAQDLLLPAYENHVTLAH